MTASVFPSTGGREEEVMGNNAQPKHGQRESTVRHDQEERMAGKIPAKREGREPAPDREAFSAKLALSRTFVAAPTD
jgi:hypothetical protein